MASKLPIQTLYSSNSVNEKFSIWNCSVHSILPLSPPLPLYFLPFFLSFFLSFLSFFLKHYLYYKWCVPILACRMSCYGCSDSALQNNAKYSLWSTRNPLWRTPESVSTEPQKEWVPHLWENPKYMIALGNDGTNILSVPLELEKGKIKILGFWKVGLSYRHHLIYLMCHSLKILYKESKKLKTKKALSRSCISGSLV